MPKFTVRTGNLPKAIAATATVVEGRKAFSEEARFKTAPEGQRWCYVGYKVKEADSKIADKELPANFACLLPSLSLLDILTDDVDVEMSVIEDNNKFLVGLFQEYQDAMVHASADKETTIDATDLDALVKDYFDKTRSRSVPTMADIKEWATEFWAPAYTARVLQRNASATLETAKQTPAQTTLIIGKYTEFMQAISKKTCILSRANIAGVRTNLLGLIELKLLDKDEFSSFLVERADEHIKTIDKGQETVEADV
jgi:hypothetical protein